MAAQRRGCRFDGWGDQLNSSAWMEAFSDAGVDPDFYLSRRRDTHEPLPWDHIDILVGKAFLRSEWENADNEGLTADCRSGSCNACGVCDFKSVAPRVHAAMPPRRAADAVSAGVRIPVYRKLQVHYSKLGPARFFGHLELVNIFLRALRRAGIPLKFSEGFHPKPRVAFDNPLPTGLESEDELMVVTVASEVTPAELLRGLNAELPEGLNAHACCEEIEDRPARHTFRIMFDQRLPVALEASLVDIDFERHLEVSSPKGKLKKIALRDILFDIRRVDPTAIDMTLSCEAGKIVRPSEVLKQIFGISAQTLTESRIRKLKKHHGYRDGAAGEASAVPSRQESRQCTNS